MGTDITINVRYREDGHEEPIELSSNGKTTSPHDFFRNYDAFNLLQYDTILPYCIEQSLSSSDIRTLEAIRNRFSALSADCRKLARADMDDYYYGHSVYSLADLKQIIELVNKALRRCKLEKSDLDAITNKNREIVYDNIGYSVEEFIDYVKTSNIPLEDAIRASVSASKSFESAEQYEHIDGLIEDIESVLFFLKEVYNRTYYRFIVWYSLNKREWATEEEMVADGLDKVLLYMKFDS